MFEKPNQQISQIDCKVARLRRVSVTQGDFVKAIETDVLIVVQGLKLLGI